MASSHLTEDMECSICLNVYTDPVTLKCGHNFCRVCIGRTLDTQRRSGGYFCPECRQKLKRPNLKKNIALCKILQTLQTTQGDQDKTGISCTYCIHTPAPAVISCLLCEASLCINHLRVHSKTPEHVLCDPTTSLENRKCSVHKKILEYYCTKDSTSICVSCRLDGEHRGHQVETLDEASEKKKNKLRNVLQKLMTEREKMEKRVQSLQEHGRKVQGEADDETERVTALFRDLRRHLEDLEKRVLREISGQAERISGIINDLVQDLEIKEELSRKLRHIEELCNVTDPLTVLQESDTGDLCDTEDGDDEDRERHDKLLHDGGDLDVGGISHTLHTGLSDIMSGVIVEKCPGTHVYPHSTTKGEGHINAEPSRRPPQPSPTLQPSRKRPQPSSTLQPSRKRPSPTIEHSHSQAGGPNIGGVQQTSGFTDILLNEKTAGNYLHISDDRKTASWSANRQNRPATPQRFRCSQVMSSQCFSLGRHYWEVDVRRAEFWTVGMCYTSIARRGGRSLIGYNKKSWGLARGWGNQYSVIHDTNEVPLPGDVSSGRVRIDLDYEAGRISFYLCDPIRHLHTFTTTFTDPLHAGVCVWKGMGNCIKICGGESEVRNLPRDW